MSFRFRTRRAIAIVVAMLACAWPKYLAAAERATFSGEFAPASGMVTPEEHPFRDEVCLDGLWQFQPVPLPTGYVRNSGSPPELPTPTDAWESTPIKIPSPWNVNTWGAGRDVGAGTSHPYWPGSVYFPSYPQKWDGVEMGWLRRTFRVPQTWRDRRIILHFEAVAGECEILINGKTAGSHFDKYLPFGLDITSLLKPGDNKLLVGVRASALFNLQSSKYAKMRCPYPSGSSTDNLVGIWQDVFLLAEPTVHVADIFVKPLVDQHRLDLEIRIRNDSDREQHAHVGGDIHPWINLAGTDVLSAPVPKSKLGPAILALSGSDVTIPAHRDATVTLHQPIQDQLKLWAPGAPNLYAAVVSIDQNGRAVDWHSTRFGWRQFQIAGKNLLLNGQKIQLTGDLLHPFGPFILSRRYAWAWYKMVQDFGGNCVRLHAQIHPKHYLELADEMGLIVLDETAIFGSAVNLNFEPDIAWQRFSDEYDGLILRDRNHPSVLGWSVGNELFAIFNLNHVSPEDSDRWYKQLGALAHHADALDPTRPWISCDGDEDLRGALPTYSKHFGLGLPVDRLPGNIDKPLMVGESGGTYYAKPAELAIFNGPGAYESYASRNDALGIDVYDNIIHMAMPRLAYYSASETAWFGVEHLNFGYKDFTRLPNETDGIFFTAPYQEGKPGIQPERLPPYVATLNPGWDSTLPLYKPLGMFEAEKAALNKAGPQPCEWDHRAPMEPVDAKLKVPDIAQVSFIGDRSGALAHRLSELGVTLIAPPAVSASFVVIDGDALAKSSADTVLARQMIADKTATVLLIANDPSDDLRSILPLAAHLTDRTATALNNRSADPWTASLTAPKLYFAEQGGEEKYILRHGLAGPIVDHGSVLLAASNTDWSLFNDVPEFAKCGAEVLYEHLIKQPGAALVRYDLHPGELAICTIDYHLTSPASVSLWRTLLGNMGVRLGESHETGTPALVDNALAAALVIGRFGAADLDAALSTDNLGDAAASPRASDKVGSHRWEAIRYADHDRFLINQFDPNGAAGPCSVYFSYWISSPRALDELLAGGPDVPRLSEACYVSEKCRLFLNGREIIPTRTEPADYRTLYTFDGLPLNKGWNHFIVKVAASKPNADPPPTLSVRLLSNDPDYLRQLNSAIERPHPKD